MSERTALLLLALALLFGNQGGACGGGGGGSGSGPGSCDGACAQQSLDVDQVKRVVAQAVAEATLLGVDATVAVVDRVGNVLAVYQMAPLGMTPTTTVTSGRSTATGLDGVAVPSTLAAISKAGTAAYLSSQGNAFTTRTASQIIQQNFNPGEFGRPGGPLFGVQFSQLPCGDVVREFGADMLEGPKRMPLGLAGDPGGIPLYEGGVPVGGVGVEFDGLYSIDLDPIDVDVAPEERVASAASWGFRAPTERRADRIAVDGKFLRFADDEEFAATSAEDFDDLPPGLVAVPGFYEPVPLEVKAGALLLSEDPAPLSGVVSTTISGLDAEILLRSGSPAYPAKAAVPMPGVETLTLPEVEALLGQALGVARSTRSQIRRPAGSAARVNVAVVDAGGEILGLVRSPDAPIFGIDVAVQKARTAAFFSSVDAAAELTAAAAPPAGFNALPLGGYVLAVRAFLGDPSALANGIAFSDRAGGNLSRPFFPDGINGKANGPFSRLFPEWSPFGTGLQLDMVLGGLLDALCPALSGGPCPAPPTSCTDPSLDAVGNGIQIFPGSVPIYKGGERVGGIGVSGDGVDQDDLVAFLGVHRAGIETGTLANADPAIRADTISVGGVNLRYVNCPVSPFLDSTAQNVCEGK